MTKKTFASFEQQIQHLEDKVIIISDRAYAEAMLKQIGYFPLIGGYKHLFRVPFTKTYKIGTTFEEIVALYEFDSDLRDLFFKYLLQIERNLRSLMSYYFTEKYGESQDAYLDSSNYNTNRRNQKVVARLISTLKLEVGHAGLCLFLCRIHRISGLSRHILDIFFDSVCLVFHFIFRI